MNISAVQLMRNDVKVEAWTLREVKAENMSAESRFLLGRMFAFALEEGGEVHPKQKHHLKVQTNKSAAGLILRACPPNHSRKGAAAQKSPYGTLRWD